MRSYYFFFLLPFLDFLSLFLFFFFDMDPFLIKWN